MWTGTVAGLRNLVLGMRAEAEGKDPHEAVAAANAEDEAGDATEGEAPAVAAVDPVDEAPAEAASEPESAEPQGVPNFDDEPQEAIDTEGATAESHEAPAAVYGGAATAPVAPRTRERCRSLTAPAKTRPPRWPCRPCRRSRLTRLSPSCTCAFTVRR